MEFFDAVRARRSIRKYTPDIVPNEVMEQALDAALLAPNSSNMQTWRIYWIHETETKKKIAHACMNQGAARTAQELVVFVADPSTWKVAQEANLKHLGPNARKDVITYYKVLMPFLYSWRFLAPVKWLVFNIMGLIKPVVRKPWSSRDISEVAVKSTALASENFMLAISAQGYDTCPMEGFDERRVKKILKLSCRASVVMIISVGKRDEGGLAGERFRLPKEMVIKKI
ncbi:nitroreductase family protein [Bdellovibrio sp. HCB209]|uniref:nitroreductase family protein n=1 Tax=Bdellovibrio sp. HCB209 TaxID=3394354 RepID=UPI0039B5771B